MLADDVVGSAVGGSEGVSELTYTKVFFVLCIVCLF